MKTTDFQQTTETKLKRIAWLSARDKDKVFNNLMHLFNEESLKACYYELDGRKAVGADGVTKEQYGEQLDANLKVLVGKLKSLSYRPGDIRVVNIPKEGQPNATRPLGISNFEDRLVQMMMHKVLESIYEPNFLDCSYGFRPGRGCHDAVRALRQHLYENKVESIIDIDLANFFGTIEHEMLLNILHEKIQDKQLLRYIVRMLKAGYLTEGDLTLSDEGVVQGSICSPIMSNIFAHYVLDRWFEEVVKIHCKGKVELYRYCDDAVICCQYEVDARRVRDALAKRLVKYKLRLNEEKTKMVNFSKSEYEQGGKVESFDFLGFTFYWGRARSGIALPKVKSSGKRLRFKLKKVNEWAKANRNKYLTRELWRRFCLKLEGHIRYFGVSFNIRGLKRFLHRATRIMFKWLNRRSQRNSFTWERFELFRQANPLPKAKIWHALW
jgi:group II intron reverse transcriptase/maturase